MSERPVAGAGGRDLDGVGETLRGTPRRGWRRTAGAAGIVLAFLISPLAVLAQPLTDFVPRERVLPLKESLEQKAEDYRFRLGPLLLAPRLGIEGLTYERYLASTDTPIEDWRSTVVAGAGFLARVGGKVWIDGSAEARYEWYAQQVDRRRWGVVYGGAVTAFLGRLTLRGRGGYDRTTAQATSETELVFDQETTSASALAEYELLRRLAVWGTWTASDIAFPTQGLGEAGSAAASSQDRQDATWRAGVRYRFSSRFWIAAAVEGNRTDYENRTDITSSDGRGLLLTVRYERPRLFVSFGGGLRRYEWVTEGGIEKPDAPAGALFISYDLTRKVEVQLYGDLGDFASVFQSGGVFRQGRIGTGLVFPVGRFLKLSGFYEIGRNNYYAPVVAPDGTVLDRRDYVDKVIGRADVPIGKLGAVGVSYEKTWYDSNMPGLKRSSDRLTVSLLAGIGVF